jgi:hypothetical protein
LLIEPRDERFASVIFVVSFSACASALTCWIGVAPPFSAVGLR